MDYLDWNSISTNFFVKHKKKTQDLFMPFVGSWLIGGPCLPSTFIVINIKMLDGKFYIIYLHLSFESIYIYMSYWKVLFLLT